MKPYSLKHWWYLVTEEEETENIRLHQLVERQELPSLAEFKHTKALILINTVDNYQLAGDIVSSAKEAPLPILVVKQSDGKAILGHLEFQEGESIFASIGTEETSPQVDEMPTQQNVLPQGRKACTGDGGAYIASSEREVDVGAVKCEVYEVPTEGGTKRITGSSREFTAGQEKSSEDYLVLSTNVSAVGECCMGS
jgi:hypothetical protein